MIALSLPPSVSSWVSFLRVALVLKTADLLRLTSLNVSKSSTSPALAARCNTTSLPFVAV